jgi:hypothetical protein
METTININVVTGREYKITSSQISQITIYYNGMKVAGAGLNNRFIALAGINTLKIVSSVSVQGSITVTEYMRNLYNMNDGQGGVIAFKEKWLGGYGFRPEWMGAVGNRLVTFLNGYPYIHSGNNNSFYGQVQDSIISFAHSESGNTVKVYDTIAVEGSTPDKLHIRTEVPNIQSSDLVRSDFQNKEGVKYAPIFRDRLSPNSTGSYEQKLMSGDKVRGEIAKFQVVFSQPSNPVYNNFVNINFEQSKGQTV